VILDLSCPFSVKVSPLTVRMAFIVRKSTVTDMEVKVADLRRHPTIETYTQSTHYVHNFFTEYKANHNVLDYKTASDRESRHWEFSP